MHHERIEDNEWLYRGKLVKWKDDGRVSVVVDINFYYRDFDGFGFTDKIVEYLSEDGYIGEIDAACFGVMTEAIT